MIKEKLLYSLAAITKKIAKTASSSTSFYYSYQPKVPESLKKD